MRSVDSPQATATVRFLSEAEGGRPRPPGPVIASTAIVAPNGDPVKQPEMAVGAEHFSVLLDFDTLIECDVAEAKVEFLAYELVRDKLKIGTEFWFMAGNQVIAVFRLDRIYAK